MNKNLLKLIAVCGTACFLACTAPQKAETEKWSERMARSEMQRFPEPWMIEKAKKPRWGYTHGLVVKSMLEEWKHTGDSTYYEYAKIYAHIKNTLITLVFRFHRIPFPPHTTLIGNTFPVFITEPYFVHRTI